MARKDQKKKKKERKLLGGTGKMKKLLRSELETCQEIAFASVPMLQRDAYGRVD